jgi:hypothetical protein
MIFFWTKFKCFDDNFTTMLRIYILIFVSQTVVRFKILVRLSSMHWYQTHQNSQKSRELIRCIIKKIHLVRFEFLTSMHMKMAAFWKVAPCGLIDVRGRFRGACCHMTSLMMDGAKTQNRVTFRNSLCLLTARKTGR